MKYLVLFPLMVILPGIALSQSGMIKIPLYPQNKIPNNTDAPDREKSEINGNKLLISHVKTPTLSIYLPPPEKATGSAVIICPGGGYSVLSASHEGKDVAIKLNESGVAAFVLKYRIPDVINQPNPSIAPIQDAQQAILTIRSRAGEWGINPDKIGIMGFSAGGHLASTAGTHFNKSYIQNDQNVSLRPDFMILIYPVISSDSLIAHKGSFNNLLGMSAGEDQLRLFSNEKQVTKDTPPTFLVHASDDKGVPVDNSILFYQELNKHGVPAAMHLYQSGGHGFGLNNPTTRDSWMKSCIDWLEENGFLNNSN